jgi:hypothetical protein
MRRGRLFALTVLLAGLAPPVALAQQTPAPPSQPQALPARTANYAWDHDLLRASFSYRDVLDNDPALRRKLSSGLPMHIAMRAYVYEDSQSTSSPTSVTLAPRICTVNYDLWEEVFKMHISEPGRERDLAAVVLNGAIRDCAEARDLAVVQRSLLKPGTSYFLGVIVEVNPVSQDMMNQMRQWITRPNGSSSIGPTNALFGGFVSLFAPNIPSSDKTITFRTQDFTP